MKLKKDMSLGLSFGARIRFRGLRGVMKPWIKKILIAIIVRIALHLLSHWFPIPVSETNLIHS